MRFPVTEAMSSYNFCLFAWHEFN